MLMDIYQLQDKFSRCNKNIYIDLKHRIYTINKDRGSSGIYLKNKKTDTPIDLFGVYGKEKTEAEILNEAPDLYLGWVAHGRIPEGHEFDLVSGKLLCPGWRALVKRFVDGGHISRDKAKKVFEWEESFYDKLSYEQKLSWHREEVEKKKGLLCLAV